MLMIREALEFEIEGIRRQRLEAYEEHAKSISEQHWTALKNAITSDADTRSGAQLFVAEWNGEMAGSVALFPAKTQAYRNYVEKLDYPEIRMLAVNPLVRKQGIASALISECITRTKAQSGSYIGLHTADYMSDAMRLYERMGFERIPQHDFQPADDNIIVKAYRFYIGG